MNNQYYAYSDGSGDNRNPYHPGGSAYIILDHQRRLWKKNSKGFLNTTTNRMELLAIISIVNALPQGSSVIIFTDSQYCTKAVNIKYPLKNADQLARYHQIVDSKQLKVVLQWIRGHAGNYYNELCDQMARDEYNKMLTKLCQKGYLETELLPVEDNKEEMYSQITTKGKRKKTKKK